MVKLQDVPTDITPLPVGIFLMTNGVCYSVYQITFVLVILYRDYSHYQNITAMFKSTLRNNLLLNKLIRRLNGIIASLFVFQPK